MKAPVICIVHLIPTRSDGVCPCCEGHYQYELLRDYRRFDLAERIANKLIAEYENDLEQWRRKQ